VKEFSRRLRYVRGSIAARASCGLCAAASTSATSFARPICRIAGGGREPRCARRSFERAGDPLPRTRTFYVKLPVSTAFLEEGATPNPRQRSFTKVFSDACVNLTVPDCMRVTLDQSRKPTQDFSVAKTHTEREGHSGDLHSRAGV
jgi:hypothetical protein